MAGTRSSTRTLIALQPFLFSADPRGRPIVLVYPRRLGLKRQVKSDTRQVAGHYVRYDAA